MIPRSRVRGDVDIRKSIPSSWKPETQDLKAQGVDVVIGYFEPHSRKDTIAKAEGLDIIPRKKVEYRGSVFEEMDTHAILARRPQVCVVDE